MIYVYIDFNVKDVGVSDQIGMLFQRNGFEFRHDSPIKAVDVSTKKRDLSEQYALSGSEQIWHSSFVCHLKIFHGNHVLCLFFPWFNHFQWFIMFFVLPILSHGVWFFPLFSTAELGTVGGPSPGVGYGLSMGVCYAYNIL